MKERFEIEKVEHQEYGTIIVLRSGDEETGKERKLYLAPDYGFNLVKYEVDGKDLIYTMPDILRNEGFSGIPILYPTPNRVRDAKFRFDGQDYLMQKKGEPRYLHGLVYDEKWTLEELLSERCEAACSAWIDFQEGNACYESFPWKHRLKVTWKMISSGIRLEYEVRNKDKKTMPYGFAIHPYFPVRAFGKTAYIRVPAKQLYESTMERFPTGNIIQAAGTEYDLSRARKVTKTKLDDVYTGMSRESAEIFYGSHRMVLTASEEFSQMVVYTPDEEFFCLENQTCMTDAHNFYDRGYTDSGLLFADSGSVCRGWIEMRTKNI